MFPNSPNTRLTLLNVHHVTDEIGQKKLVVINSKEVIGMIFSVTSKEYYESKSMSTRVDRAIKIQSILYDSSKYAIIQDTIYRIERTYTSGQFIELYLVETKLKEDDIIDFPR